MDNRDDNQMAVDTVPNPSQTPKPAEDATLVVAEPSLDKSSAVSSTLPDASARPVAGDSVNGNQSKEAPSSVSNTHVDPLNNGETRTVPDGPSAEAKTENISSSTKPPPSLEAVIDNPVSQPQEALPAPEERPPPPAPVPVEETPMSIDQPAPPPVSTPKPLETLPSRVRTPRPVNGTPAGSPTQAQSQREASPERPLNVTDALSYLDAVKVQFQNQPDVYNRFLDIMKEFKNELIDTPGVIRRVSHLFNGHPSLIQGFNTFLPQGYRIDIATDAQDSTTSYITVTTPAGTLLQSTTEPLPERERTEGARLRPPPEPAKIPEPPASKPAPVPMSSPDPRALPIDGQAIEPAVQYVQKIKQRCDPEVYRQFLEILSQYHNHPETIDEEEVSRQIARLFKDAPDLRSDFRIFMPAHSQNLDDPTILAESSKGKRKLDSTVPPNVPNKRKRKPVEKEPVTITKPQPSAKKPKPAIGQDLTPASYNGKTHPQPPSPPSLRTTVQAPPPHTLPPAPQGMPINAPPLPTRHDDMLFFDNVRRMLDNRDTYNEFLKIVNLFTQDFIDTARLIKEASNFLGDTELMKQFKSILGWDEWKEKEAFEQEQRMPFGWTRPSIVGVLEAPSRAQLNAKYGSYRKLSSAEVTVPCSGRDEMCRSVLNDEWVSHPSWSSEESGFISHRKNVFEEALHRSEEERHEYDFHIDAITRTISLLEPIAHKIASLTTQEERNSFKLKPNLGGGWKAIHSRVVKKIYGRDPGLEVIQCMQDAPAVAIPVVLARLKTKEEEWKRAQREWNKVWREVERANYWKALDWRGVWWRGDEKKNLSVRGLVSQIESVREEQVNKRAGLVDTSFGRTGIRHQLEFTFGSGDETRDDKTGYVPILQDAMKLTLSYLDRTQGQIPFAERRRVENFLRSFIPLFFSIDVRSFNEAFAFFADAAVIAEGSEGSDGDVAVSDLETIASVSNAGSKRGGKKGNNAATNGLANASGADLRKKLLKAEQAKSTNQRRTRGAQQHAEGSSSTPASRPASRAGSRAASKSPAVSRMASPAPAPIFAQNANEDIGAVMLAQAQELSKRLGGTPGASRRNVFFSNTAFYCLLRLIEILHSRLARFKTVSADMAKAAASKTSPNAQVDGVPPQSISTNGETKSAPNAEHYYDLLLETLERLFDGEIEQHAFEEQLRVMFGVQEAYLAFTIDKVVGGIIKQVQSILPDVKGQDLLELLKKERALALPTTQDQLNYRRNSEKVLGPDENLFRVDWLPETQTMTFQLIGKDDSSIDDSEVVTGRWQRYIDSFVSSDATDGVPQSMVKSPFLRRNLPAAVRDSPPNVLSQDGLEIKICVRTYRPFFVPKSEDILVKLPGSNEETRKTREAFDKRNKLRQKWVETSKKTPPSSPLPSSTTQ